MDISQHIEINPKIMMGKPVIKGTRITVESLLEKLSSGETEEDILLSHPHITKENIKAALAFAAQSLKGENIYPVTAEQIREKLHQYIDKLDETRLDEVYKIIEEEDVAWQYSAEDIKMFYQRRTSYLNGEGKNYTMDESINSIRK